MAETRETRTHASEIKFVVDRLVGVEIRDWARQHLPPDPHGSGLFGDEYTITSLYFDTSRHDVFHRRGSFGRAKYRIRRYGHNDTVFLERKLRRPTLLVKRRTKVSFVDLARLNGGRVDGRWLGTWFERRVAARQLGPTCQISYRRVARGATGPPDSVRMTVDESIVATPATTVKFSSDPGVPVLDGAMIVELKFRGILPATFRRLLEDFRLSQQTASKYRLGMAAAAALFGDDTEPASVSDVGA
jgi:hypothetical protein